jgi:hypothetical protein
VKLKGPTQACEDELITLKMKDVYRPERPNSLMILSKSNP